MKKYICVECESFGRHSMPSGFHLFVHWDSKPPEGYREITLAEMNTECFHIADEKVCVDVLRLVQDLLVDRRNSASQQRRATLFERVNMRKKIDWVESFETPLRACLREYSYAELSPVETVRLIDEILAEATGRGNELSKEPLDWERRDIVQRIRQLYEERQK